MGPMIQVGLTGGIASGKTTAAEMFARRGARIIEADTLAHEALKPGTATCEQVVRVFGRTILNQDGTVSRTRLGDIVFADAHQRQRLNAIVHPAVRAAWTAALERMRGEGFRGIAVVVIPLLYEVGAESGFRVVVAVGCSPATQRARLMSRGLTDAQCRERMDAQWPQARKLEKADFVIWNDSPLPVLDQQVRRVVDRIGARMRTN